MSGSESKSDRGTNGASPNEANRTSLADFLAPPRSRGSVPAPAIAADAKVELAAVEPAATTVEPAAAIVERAPSSVDAAWESAPVAPVAAPAAVAESTAPAELTAEPVASEAATVPPALSAEATTPTEPTPVVEATARVPADAVRTAEPLASQAPPPKSDAAARSLIPVATSTTSDGPEVEMDDDLGLPGAGPPWSGAAVRRVTFLALLAAAAAVPAWVVIRARSVEVQARSEGPKLAAASAGPSTLQPAREIEADEEPADEEPAVAAVAVDPVKALEVRREARRLLEAGQIATGVAAARNAIALNPADPESYVLLAAGLQDLGQWAESREVFSRCVHKSNNAINAECVYFATSGTITNR